jgi:hypothetical protein
MVYFTLKPLKTEGRRETGTVKEGKGTRQES